MKNFALVGNPNCGKTTLFNALTGSTAHVGNWPGVTVDKKVGVYKNSEEPVNIVDLPGIYSLSPYTPEEVISRNYIIDEKPDCVINIVDATNLERNLYLTTQILEMDVPVIIALNMMDVVEANGDKIDTQILEREIGVPVVGISAQKGTGIEQLIKKGIETSNTPRKATSVLKQSKLSHIIKDVKTAFKGLEVSSPLFHAIKLIENDEIEVKDHPNLVKIVDEFKTSFNDDVFGTDLEAIIADARYQYITANYTKCRTISYDNAISDETKSDKIDKVLTNRWAGIPIFLVILFLIFHLTFSENLFFLGGLFKNVAPSFEGTLFEGLFWTDAGINSPGVMLQTLMTGCTDGLSNLASSLLSSASPWAQGLVVDGILAGVFSVLSFVPQILLLFLLFSILEDSGYMSRIAFILDRIFRKFGLSGRAFMPMIMGFGCSVPAMINTRTLADEKERTATVRVIPFFSCGAKLPILTAIAGAICVLTGLSNVDIITYSMYVVGIVTAIIAIILMRNTTMRGDVPPFIMELPSYHMPQFKSLMLHLWDKLKHYVEKAFTIILASTIIIWFLQSFTWDWKYIDQASPADIAQESYEVYIADSTNNIKFEAVDENYVEDGKIVVTLDELLENDSSEAQSLVLDFFEAAINDYKDIVEDKSYLSRSDSILASVGKFAQPIFTPLGFGKQLNENGWIFGVSAVTGLIAKENVVATFNVLSQAIESNVTTAQEYKDLYLMSIDEDGVIASNKAAQSCNISANASFTGWPVLISFIVFNMTTIPCFAAVATARGELTKKKFRNTVIFWIVTSYLASAVIYTSLSAWWTSFIFIAALASLFAGISIYNKKHKVKA